MTDYSTVSDGWYALVPRYDDADAILDAIVSMLY